MVEGSILKISKKVLVQTSETHTDNINIGMLADGYWYLLWATAAYYKLESPVGYSSVEVDAVL